MKKQQTIAGIISLIGIIIIEILTITITNMNSQQKAKEMEVVGATEVKNTEMISKKNVKDTPFTIVSLNETNEHFAVMGEYRVTEKYDDVKKVEKEVKKITWNRIIQVIMIMKEKDGETTK